MPSSQNLPRHLDTAAVALPLPPDARSPRDGRWWCPRLHRSQCVTGNRERHVLVELHLAIRDLCHDLLVGTLPLAGAVWLASPPGVRCPARGSVVRILRDCVLGENTSTSCLVPRCPMTRREQRVDTRQDGPPTCHPLLLGLALALDAVRLVFQRGDARPDLVTFQTERATRERVVVAWTVTRPPYSVSLGVVRMNALTHAASVPSVLTV